MTGRLSAARRGVAVGLLAAQVQGCAPVWKPTDRMAPADVVADWQPPVVKLDLANGESLELVQVWVRADSVGGLRRDKERGAAVAVALTEVRVLQVRDVPSVASRIARGDGGSILSPGERVRITRAGPGGHGAGSVVGWLERLTGDAIMVAHDDGSLLEFPLDQVLKLELRIRAGSRVLRGVGIGLGIAVALGLAGFAVYEATGDCEGEACWVPGAVAVFGAGGLGLLAILIGTGVGAATLGEHWEEVPLCALRGGPP